MTAASTTQVLINSIPDSIPPSLALLPAYFVASFIIQTTPIMLFKSIIVVLSAVLQTAVLAAPGAIDDQAETRTNYVRKMKKDRQRDKGSDNEDEAAAAEVETNSINDGELADQDGVFDPSSIPVLRNSARLNTASDDWNHGSFALSVRGVNQIKVFAPEGTLPGDTLFLFLSISDAPLPLRIDGWERGASCFKTRNQQSECLKASQCVQRDGPFCLKFEKNNIDKGDGRDLATVLFYKHVTAQDPGCWTIDLYKRAPTWAIVTAVPNVNQLNPIFRSTGTSCDRNKKSEFPSVYGKANDVLLLSQCFDDRALVNAFQPPETTQFLGFTNSYDEAGFLFGKRLDTTEHTGELITRGNGAFAVCKDALLSVVVNRE